MPKSISEEGDIRKGKGDRTSGMKASLMLAPRMSTTTYNGLCDLVNKSVMVNGFIVRKKTSSFSEARAKSPFSNFS